ncbi:MAG: hypothetical protein PHS49_08140 [Candidatus Gracilibacteria bacterium]|nr:hypothetical protein [Candidatus Gracilibacteria bacterium]
MVNINVKMFDGSTLVLNEDQKSKLQFLLNKYFGNMFIPNNAVFFRKLNTIFIEFEEQKSIALKQTDSEFVLDLCFTSSS